MSELAGVGECCSAYTLAIRLRTLPSGAHSSRFAGATGETWAAGEGWGSKQAGLVNGKPG